MSIDESPTLNFCIIIPAYNEGKVIASVVHQVLAYCNNIIVIDDGSSDDTIAQAEQAGATVLPHKINRGKGLSLETGFTYAKEQNFDFVITMDADGQHAPDDLPNFINEYRRTGTPVIVGNRMQHPDNMPLVRRLTNQFMSWLLSREMKQSVPDTQSGYRLYKCTVLEFVKAESTRFAAESESLLNLAYNKIKIASVPIKVIYGDEKSKINPINDTMRFFQMLSHYKSKHKS